MATSISAQITNTGNTIPYNPKFPDGTTLEEIKDYLSSNIASLDPIEGLYDLTWKSFVTYDDNSSRESEDAYTVAIVKNGNLFYFYAPYNKIYTPHIWLIIEPIGSTGIYNFIITNKETPQTVRIYSKQRVPLEHGILFNYQHKFSRDELYAQGSQKYGITGSVRNLSGIKIFPDANTISPLQPETWTGTGFALKNKYIVTNYHVVDGASKISVKGIQGNFNKSYTAEIVGLDKINDLALIRITDSDFTGFGTIPYSISNITADVGSEIYVLGFPLTATMGEEIKLTTGIISSKTGFQGDVALYQISAPIQPGNSGGPLFDSKGNIIGIVSAKHNGAENVGYAIKTNYLRNLVESCSSLSILPTSNLVASLPLTGKVKIERNFVFYITCTK